MAERVLSEPTHAPTGVQDPNAEGILAASSVLRALSILDAFSSTESVLGVGELSRRLGVHKSTISRLAATLEGAGYLQRLADGGRYRLGPKLVRLGVLAQSQFDLRRAARPSLEALADECGETAHLGVLDGADAVTVDFVDGRFAVRMHTVIGKRTPSYCSAIGKVLLAGLEHDVFADLLDGVDLEPRTPRTLKTQKQLAAELGEIIRLGYSFDNEELEVGMRCLGAPIFDGSGAVIAAISISGPTTRINSRTLTHVADMVKRAAAATSARLGAPHDRQAWGHWPSSDPGGSAVQLKNQARTGTNANV